MFLHYFLIVMLEYLDVILIKKNEHLQMQHFTLVNGSVCKILGIL